MILVARHGYVFSAGRPPPPPPGFPARVRNSPAWCVFQSVAALRVALGIVRFGGLEAIIGAGLTPRVLVGSDTILRSVSRGCFGGVWDIGVKNGGMTTRVGRWITLERDSLSRVREVRDVRVLTQVSELTNRFSQTPLFAFAGCRQWVFRSPWLFFIMCMNHDNFILDIL